MAKTSDRVMDMVRREVEKNPGVKSGELYEKAKKLDRSISSLTLRQFHARYPLQVKRIMKSGGAKKKTRRKAATGRRKTAGRRRTAAKKRRATKKRATGKRTAAKKRKTTKRAATKKRATTTRRGGARKKATRRPARSTRTRRASGATPADRGSVRAVLLEFAGEVATAENKADMISVVAGMDRWVDRVTRAAR